MNKTKKWYETHRRTIYALYDGDVLLAHGTKQEISEQTGLSPYTLSSYHTPAVQARGDRALINVGIEGDDDE